MSGRGPAALDPAAAVAGGPPAEWSRAAVAVRGRGLVHARFAAQARRRPDAPALIGPEPGAPPLTYGELAARVRRLAAHLRALGVGPGVLVAIHAERSARTVEAILAVLAAGGAYLPLDPGYPRERLAFMLEDSRAAVLLTREGLAAELPAGRARPVLLDRLLPIDDLPAAPAAGEEATAGDLAYVIYTSGSTGRPKGVLLAHRGLADLAEAHVQLFGIGSGSRVLQFASPSFDASVSEIWSALVCGAALVLGRREDLLPGPALAGFLSGRGITHVTLPPTALAALAAAAGETGDGLPPLPDLECLVVAGEAFPAALAARWSAGRRLLNAYGPTEATVCATAAVLAGPAVGLRPPPIGRPVAGSRIYVVDEELRPVPAGKAGELLLGGPGLAWGYIGLPESTAAAFVPDPFARSSGEAGGRLYRTGDRVRFLPDGELEFLGRVDRQVKVRGYRIEPGEVEAALLRHPALGAAAVVAREPDAARGDRRLVAYVVPHGGGAVPAPAELRRFLAAELPDFMIPAAFVALDRLPLSPNGKVDLQALPALPEPGAAAASGLEPAPSRTPVEEVLAGIWAHVLGTPETSPIADDDDFFVLGGHSLLIGEVVSRVRAALGVELPLREAFAAPTFAALAGRVEAALASGRPPLPAVERLDRRGAAGLALSFAQERLWFLHRLAPASPVYNMPSLFRLEGDLDAEALARCLAEIVRRQESLRTTFAEAAGGEPRQAVAPPPAAADLPWIDLRGLPLAAARAEALGWISAEAWRPFDLAAGPLFRPLLFSPAAGDHLLLLAMHHIAGDGESMEVLAGELAAIYPEARTGRPSPLAELPVQYADVAAWQRRRLAGEALAPELEYWRQRLAGAIPLELPADRARPPVQSFRGASLVEELPPRLAGALAGLGRRLGATLFMTALAGFLALLRRYTGQDDLTVGTPVANRGRPEIEGLVGFFANTLVLRADLAGDPTAGELVARVRAAALGAYAHQDAPFERLVEELDAGRDLSRNPLFQTLFVLQSQRARELAPGLRLAPLDLAARSAKFDLLLALIAGEGRLAASLEYSTDLFDTATMVRLAGHLGNLLAALAAADGARRRLSELPLLSAAEEHEVVAACNDTAVAWPVESLLHELIAAQAVRTPEAIAVSFEGETLTYGELDERAERLAARLRGFGVGPEEVVGICAERSLEMVVGLLATLKAGGAYLPLDPGYPADRLSYMLANARPAVLLAQERLADRVAAGAETRLVLLDGAEEEPAVEAPERRPATADGAAYVIYTSGSTGRPKGVVNTHRGIVNRLLWMQAAYGLTAADRVLQKTPASFDVSVWEFFWPLLTGARLVMARPDGHQDAAYLVETIEKEGITTLHFVPSMLQVWLEEPNLSRCAGLKRVICSGEALLTESAERFFARLGEPYGVELHNLYGPTEAAVDVTFWQCEPGGGRGRGGVPIGRPIANTQIYLLDREGRPVPVGVAGELRIGGVGLARGYLRRPELTAERFVPNPLAVEPGQAGTRLYRTGDLARRLPGGEIEFLGRIDHQVKIRGFRIEIGEIESTLTSLPAVAEAVVLLQEHAPGDKRLAAYVVPDAEQAVAARRMLRLEREGLSGRALHELPNGMPVFHLNRNETEFVFAEIFVHRSYLRHGIAVEPGACIFDVGANIGLFTLFMAGLEESVRLFCFEPIPETFAALTGNVGLYGVGARLFDCGLASEERSVEFTSYPKVSLISGFLGNLEEEREVVRAFLQSEHATLTAAQVEELLEASLAARHVVRPLRRLSNVMRENGVDRIDLLKIDVEKAELEVLGGLDEADWPKVRQVVIEVHDVEGRLAQIESLLARYGFTVAVEQDDALRRTGLYNLYARRAGSTAAAAPPVPDLARRPPPAWRSAAQLVAAVKEHARARLPEYMVPSSWALVEAIPLSPNGKVDRRALAAIATSGPEREGSGFVAPRTPTEALLAEIWADLLGVERVGAKDDFFDLGGNSLLAARAISRLRRDLGVELPVQRLFQAPTVAGLAPLVEAARGEKRASAAPPISRRLPDEEADLPLSFAQRRLWFLDRFDPGSATYNLALAYQAAGPLNPAGLAASLAALVRRHEALRTTFAGGDEGEPRQVIAPAAPIPLPICDLRGLPPDERKAVAARLAEEESHRPFDLARGPLARVSLLRLDEERYDLLATIHHIVADGWSLEIFVRELSALYGAAVAARPAPLPELPVQYADFARWQRRWLGAEALAPQIDYWRRQLAGAPASLDLPTDRPRPAVERARGAQLAVPLPAGLVPALQARAREQGATLFMILFAAFAALLHRVTGEDDVLVGTPVANRNRAELENLIGFFVNTLVLRADLADDPPFAELLARVREAALGAYGHQDVPFERLVEELQPERSLARSPLFQVAFVVAAERAETLAPGLVLTPLPVDSGTAKFELTLALLEGDAGWTASLEYKTDLFDAATIRRLFGQLQTLLEGVAADPERRLSDLPLSTAADRAEPAAGRGALAPGGAEERVRIAGSRLAASGVAAALAGHPHVESAVVVKRGDLADGPALVAYVVPREGLPEVEDLRRHLQDALPVSDLPAAWVFLDRLPLTSNGRVDRRALPPPEGRLPEAGFAPPRTPVEEVLAGVWAEVLGRERLGVYDDFFELGGHSLLGIRITSRMRALFGVDLPLRRLFEAPTLAGQAALVEAARAGSAGDGPSSPPGEPLVPMAPAVRAGGLSVSSAQQRLWFAEQMMPGSATLNIPHPLLLEGPLDPPVLAAGLEEIVARHEALRTTFALVEGELRQRVSPPAPFPLNLVDLAALPAAGRLAVAQDLSEAEARRPFDLARGPLLRAVLLRLGGEEHRLLLTLHHIVADAGSTEILESEITALYVAAPLAPLPIQYADFAAWERRRLAGEAMAAPAAYWRRQLAGLPLLALPTDRPRPPRQTFVGAVESVAVEADLTAGLRALARREGVSLFMTLYAAFAALLNRYTGQEDFGLGTPVAGRNRTEVEGLIGPFVNTLVLRADLSGDPPFRDLLARARELTLAAHAHADVPFERLVEELEGERDRDRSRSPLFQVVLALAAVPTPRRFAGITLTPLAVHTATSQFDLTLYVMEEPSRLTAGIEYNTDLFAAATVGRLLGHFRRLLEAVVTNPALRLSELPVEIRPPAPPAPPALTSPALPAASAAAVPAFAVPASGDGGPAARLAERQASLAQRRARLSAQQRELLARRLQGSWPAPAASTQPASSSLVAIQPTGSLPPFFCVHPAGGDVLCFHPLSRRLGTDQPFYGLQSHGLEAGEEPFTRVEEMAGHYAGLLRRTAAGPYFLGGWSLGAAVAFETARQLAAAGEEVALLAILDGPAGLRDHPAIDEGLYEDDARWLAEIADYVRRLWAADLRISYENLAALPPEEQLARFLEELRRVHFPPAAAGPAQLRRLLAVFKANVRALRGYAPAPYPGTITLFRPQAGDSDLGWGALTPFPLAVEIVAGDHVSALAEPHVRSLAERLGACIERAMGR